MTFKGVHIDGTLSEFSAKLRQKGFAPIGTENGITLFYDNEYNRANGEDL